MKVSQHLARHGYIIGYRGKGGGIALARPARTINLAQVLGKVEHGLGPGKAADGAARDNDDGNFRRALEDAREAFLAALAAYTLADLIAEAGPDELAVRSCGEG
jgi:Rrf2 family nitric oxide-sensitive transcriptional repressor